jgi:predicted Zn-dependent peptidase
VEYKKNVLGNGMKVITCPMPHTRSVSVLFFVMTGSCYEKDEQAGISHFVEHMCFKGTARRPASRDISEAIEGVGGIMNGGTDRELTSYWCKLASEHLELAVDVIIDLMRNPLFRAGDVDKERQVIIEEINMSLDSPQQRVGMIFDELMWPGQPMGRDVAGTRASVTAITRDGMLEYMRSGYRPNNMLVSIAGNMEEGRALECIEKAAEGWGKGEPPPYLESSGAGPGPQARIEYRETEQVNLVVGVEGPGIFHPDRYAVDLLSMIMGEGMSSRLFTEIREKLGLAYDIHSYADHQRETGVFAIQAGIEPEQTQKAVGAILEQMAAAVEGITDGEVRKAREMARGRLLLSMENSRNVAGWYGAQEVLTGKILTIEDVTRIIDSIGTEDVRRAAAELFTTEKLKLALVGPIRDDGWVEGLMKI